MPRFEFLKQHVEKGAQVIKDEGSMKLTPYFVHDFVNHQREYVRGNVHADGVENFLEPAGARTEGHVSLRRAVPPERVRGRGRSVSTTARRTTVGGS